MLAYGSRGIGVNHGGVGMAAGAGSWSIIFSTANMNQSVLEVRQGHTLSEPAPSDILPYKAVPF